MKPKLRTFCHLLAGFVILLHGWTAYQKAHPSSWIFMLLGTLFILIAIFHKRIFKAFPKIDAIVFFMEGIALAATSYDYFHEHKTYIPWVTLAASVTYVVLAFSVLSGYKKLRDH